MGEDLLLSEVQQPAYGAAGLVSEGQHTLLPLLADVLPGSGHPDYHLWVGHLMSLLDHMARWCCGDAVTDGVFILLAR